MGYHFKGGSMEKSKQKRIIRELASNIADEITAKIADGEIPVEWDGRELRQLFADKASDATFNFRKDLKRRYRDYRNFVITHII